MLSFPKLSFEQQKKTKYQGKRNNKRERENRRKKASEPREETDGYGERQRE